MRKKPKLDTWVVYVMMLEGKPAGVMAVCEQAEWDAMEKERPGVHKFVQGGILTEMEAERIARERQIVPPAPLSRRKS